MSELRDDVPLVCVCGNHDVGNSPTAEYIARYRQRFGDDYFSFYCLGVKFIVLNMQLYSDSSKAEALHAEQRAWFEQELIEARSSTASHIIVFGHIPW